MWCNTCCYITNFKMYHSYFVFITNGQLMPKHVLLRGDDGAHYIDYCTCRDKYKHPQPNLAHSQNTYLCSDSVELYTHILCQLMTLAHTWLAAHVWTDIKADVRIGWVVEEGHIEAGLIFTRCMFMFYKATDKQRQFKLILVWGGEKQFTKTKKQTNKKKPKTKET